MSDLSETVTLASYKIAWNIARAKKPNNEGEFVKTCLSDIIEILSPENDELKQMVSDIKLSHNTVEHRISDINMAIDSQFQSDLKACEYFSIALDKCCDIQDKLQLVIFTHFTLENGMTLKSEGNFCFNERTDFRH